MKALTLWQPWATLVAVGAKRIETRSWGTSYRGWLAIHAARYWSKETRRLCGGEPFLSTLQPHWVMGPRDLPAGCVVAICRLVACERMTEPLIAMVEEPERSFGDYRPGRYMWMLGDVRLLGPYGLIMATGRQGLWDWEPPAALVKELGL